MLNFNINLTSLAMILSSGMMQRFPVSHYTLRGQ